MSETNNFPHAPMSTIDGASRPEWPFWVGISSIEAASSILTGALSMKSCVIGVAIARLVAAHSAYRNAFHVGITSQRHQ